MPLISLLLKCYVYSFTFSKTNNSYYFSKVPLIPQFIFRVGTVPLSFLLHSAAFLQKKFDMRASGIGSYDQAGICVHDGFRKGKPSFEKRIHLLAKRKLKCYFPSVGANRKK